MNIRSLLFVILFFAKITHSFGQTEWTTLEYNPDVPEIEHNPMKGWMPGYRGINSDFPYSIDHFYIRLVMFIRTGMILTGQHLKMNLTGSQAEGGMLFVGFGYITPIKPPDCRISFQVKFRSIQMDRLIGMTRR